MVANEFIRYVEQDRLSPRQLVGVAEDDDVRHRSGGSCPVVHAFDAGAFPGGSGLETTDEVRATCIAGI